MIQSLADVRIPTLEQRVKPLVRRPLTSHAARKIAVGLFAGYSVPECIRIRDAINFELRRRGRE